MVWIEHRYIIWKGIRDMGLKEAPPVKRTIVRTPFLFAIPHSSVRVHTPDCEVIGSLLYRNSSLRQNERRDGPCSLIANRVFGFCDFEAAVRLDGLQWSAYIGKEHSARLCNL